MTALDLTPYDVRGFRGYRFSDRYGHQSSIQESSLATDYAIWLGIDNAAPKVMASEASSVGVETTKTCGWVPYPVPEAVLMHTRMHLTQQQVRDLLPMLQHFAIHGSLPKPTSPEASR